MAKMNQAITLCQQNGRLFNQNTWSSWPIWVFLHNWGSYPIYFDVSDYAWGSAWKVVLDTYIHTLKKLSTNNKLNINLRVTMDAFWSIILKRWTTSHLWCITNFDIYVTRNWPFAVTTFKNVWVAYPLRSLSGLSHCRGKHAFNLHL